MRVLIVHDEITRESGVDAADALVQAGVFGGHLSHEGHEVRVLGVGLNLAPLVQALEETDLVVNLVESLGGRGSLIHLVPTLVEALGIPMTGNTAGAIAATSNKLASKSIMSDSGIPTPEWYAGQGPVPNEGVWIVKSVWEHASIGLGPESIVDAGEVDLGVVLAQSLAKLGGLGFAERYIDGREFNLSILASETGPEVLPPAEIQFVGFDANRPRIVDYAAKWDAESFEYRNTPRIFEFKPTDSALLRRLQTIALRCWDEFALSGYARVDFRIDELGRPWVLEINTNPCVSPDAGFMAAVQRAGLAQEEAIDRIVIAATESPDSLSIDALPQNLLFE